MMATRTTNGSPLTLATYVVGISGKCGNKDYVGCGKSCLCRQFVHGEYEEEVYSTLLQTEFDGCVVNRQHAIYWGPKEETYSSDSKEKTKKPPFTATVNFEVFEHTLLYEDASNAPFSGKPYDKRVFTPLDKFLNKFSFKSRDFILSPEEYEATMFSYTSTVPVVYLYVVDVSQSCPVFVEQIQMLNSLIKSIKKSKHHCVIVANKFDSHSKENIDTLESCANELGVTVIQCSSKYNTNIDTAFKYLAMKAFGRELKKKISMNIQTHAEVAVEKRIALPKESSTNDVDINVIPHISMAGSQVAFQLLSSSVSNGSVVSQRSLSNGHRTQQATSEYNDYDLPPDYYESEIYDFPPDARVTQPAIRVHNDDPLDDSFDECSDSEDDQPQRMKRTASFGKSALNSFKRLTKLGKKNSLDVPLVGNSHGHSRSKSFGSLQQKSTTPNHTAVQHTSNEYTNVPRKIKAEISHSSPYINWSIPSAAASQ